jgi:hypothetical protein
MTDVDSPNGLWVQLASYMSERVRRIAMYAHSVVGHSDEFPRRLGARPRQTGEE